MIRGGGGGGGGGGGERVVAERSQKRGDAGYPDVERSSRSFRPRVKKGLLYGGSMERDAALDAVFQPVRPPTTFEETVERLGTAIRLGLLAPGAEAAARARARRRSSGSPARRFARR